MVVNHTALIGQAHLADTLLAQGFEVVKVLAPEHGFRGQADAGETVRNDVDTRTGLPILSLYGKQKKPLPEHLADLDVVIFDIQDVGARFYTYISTMHYVMEACAENNKPLIVLDRPNPNGWYVDGPVLEADCQSFVGMHPIPIVHGLTVGELAGMINGEGWLEGGLTCELTVIKCEGYTHQTRYSLPVRPSPNLPNDQSVLLYPTLCLFEGTALSVGRGTPYPFQVIGAPELKGKFDFSFTPQPGPGSKDPLFNGKTCYGKDYRQAAWEQPFTLSELIAFYQAYPTKDKFFSNFFHRLAGTRQLEKQIRQGLTEEQIRATWEPALGSFKQKRQKYLLYP